MLLGIRRFLSCNLVLAKTGLFCCIALTEKGIKFHAHRELAMGYATAVNIANDEIPTFATLTPALPAASWIRASMVISANSSLSSSMA